MTVSLLLFLITILYPVPMPGNSTWGFYGHKLINRTAVFLLPAEMRPLYRRNILFLTQAAVDPDRRRYVIEKEAPCHYIDMEAYDSLPPTWAGAMDLYSEDSLYAHGIVPWHIEKVRQRLVLAFRLRDAGRILKLSADLGHYIGDAHVPLHTTRNYNGQLTGQYGIHAFWESRLPELFSEEYDLFTGKAHYLPNPVDTIWSVVRRSNELVDDVLQMETLARHNSAVQEIYGYERKGTALQTVYSSVFSKRYHDLLHGMVERRLKSSILLTACFWYTCWVDAGQPDLTQLSQIDLSYAERRQQLDSLLKADSLLFRTRPDIDQE